MKLARRTSPCVACGAPIVVDTPIAPLLGQNGRIRLCIINHSISAAILIYAQAYGGCMPRARRRRHNRALIGSAAAYVTWAITALSRIRLWLTCLAVWKSKFYCASSGVTQVPGAFAHAAFTKAGRVGVFRRFVVKEFGPAAVVDVAGGKGELSFELENLHDVACVVVDPRAPMLDDVSQRFRRFRARGFFDNNEGGLGFRRRWREHEEAGVELALRRPRHLRLFFDGALVDWTVSGGDDFFAAAARRWTEQVLIGESSRKQNYAKRNGRLELLPPPPDVVPETDEWSAVSAREALLAADLLVGLHCDGAAEPIIDFALAHGKAFAIVPCCTCSKQFPHRRMNGAPVKSYDQLVAYLLAKDPRIRKARLDFDGRNACLFFRP